MDSKIHKQLEEAKTHFCSLRLVEAYNILRRFYDRLPFEQSDEHAEYIGLFARILAELGKENDLRFYLSELERLYGKSRSPALGYQLGFVYMYLDKTMREEAKRLFEEVLKNPEAKKFHVKCKLMLADYYDDIKGDRGTVKQIISSIGEVEDRQLAPLVEIWRAKVLKDEGSHPAAEAKLQAILSQLTFPEDWYGYYSAKLLLVSLYVNEKRFAEAEKLIAEVRGMFANRKFKTLQEQLVSVEKRIVDARKPTELQLTLCDGRATLGFENKQLVLSSDVAVDRFLMLLAKKGFLDKAFIVKNLFQKSYNGEEDDKLIYHAVHQARKRLQSVGIPKTAVESVDKGYRFVPKVKVVKEEL